jgi:hypothetical protein
MWQAIVKFIEDNGKNPLVVAIVGALLGALLTKLLPWIFNKLGKLGGALAALFGGRIFPTHRRLKQDNVRDFARRFRAQVGAFRRGEMTLDKLTECTRAWIAHAAHGDTYRLRGHLFQTMPIS